MTNTDLIFITNEEQQNLKTRFQVLINPFKVLAVLYRNIPERLLKSHYAEQNPAAFEKREVILSLYLAGE